MRRNAGRARPAFRAVDEGRCPPAQAAARPHLKRKDSFMPHLIAFSHLRWNFVYQRPQHLLSRLARHYPVLFRRRGSTTTSSPCCRRC